MEVLSPYRRLVALMQDIPCSHQATNLQARPASPVPLVLQILELAAVAPFLSEVDTVRVQMACSLAAFTFQSRSLPDVASKSWHARLHQPPQQLLSWRRCWHLRCRSGCALNIVRKPSGWCQAPGLMSKLWRSGVRAPTEPLRRLVSATKGRICPESSSTRYRCPGPFFMTTQRRRKGLRGLCRSPTLAGMRRRAAGE